MATAEELFALSGAVSCDLTVDPASREITVPAGVGTVAMEGDEAVRSLTFRLPRECFGTDLSELAFKVNYVNARGETGFQIPEVATVGESIALRWELCRHVAAAPGQVQFQLCAVALAADGATVDREWHTRPAAFDVGDSIDHGAAVEEEIRLDWVWRVVSDCEAATEAAREATAGIGPRLDGAVAEAGAKMEAAVAAMEAEADAAEEDRSIAELARTEAEAYRAAKFAEIEEKSDGLLYRFCGEGEYDPGTRRPTVERPHLGTHYLTPAREPSEANQWDEWVWDSVGDRWEAYGSPDMVIDPMTVDQAVALLAGAPAEGTEGELVTRRVLRFVLGQIDGIYAKIAHTHGTSGIEDGAVTAAKLAAGAVGTAKIDDKAVTSAKLADSAVGTGKIAANAVTSDKLAQSVRDSISQASGSITNGSWRRSGSIVVVAGFCSVTAAQTVKVGTLPVGCRPRTYFAAPTASGGYADVDSNGTVQVIAKPGANYYTLAFPI